MISCRVFIESIIDHFWRGIFFFSELCWGTATVAHRMPQQRKKKKEESERLRGERHQIKFIDLGFERWQVVRFKKARGRIVTRTRLFCGRSRPPSYTRSRFWIDSASPPPSHRVRKAWGNIRRRDCYTNKGQQDRGIRLCFFNSCIQ